MNITKVAKLDEVERFELEWRGEKVEFFAKKEHLTPQFLKDVGNSIGYPKAIASTVTDWDVTSDDEGTKWPLEEEALSKLPVNFLDAILGTIADSWTGSKKSQTKSASG